MKVCTIPILLLLAVLPVLAQQTEKERVVQECVKIFGVAIDSQLMLFEVNADFVLKLEFVGDGLEKFSVTPKYYFNDGHPEWKEPDERPWIEMTDYRNIIAKLERINPKGQLVSRWRIGLCSAQCWFQDYYQDAFFEYSITGRDPDAGGVGSFFICYFQPVHGKVIEKVGSNLRTSSVREGDEIIFKVKIEREGVGWPITIWVREEVYNELKVGRIQSFQGALVN